MEPSFFKTKLTLSLLTDLGALKKDQTQSMSDITSL